jgi:anti-repressor protein
MAAWRLGEMFGDILAIEKDGEPWFVGKDVAVVLGYNDTVNALKSHVYEEDKLGWQFTTSGQHREMTIINESGPYSLVLSSKLPQAKQFKHWVTAEVLPTIRRHGA